MAIHPTRSLLVGLVFAASVSLAVPAYADYLFSGAGSSGSLVSAGETWSFNADGGAAATGYLNNWGSPGVGASLATYGESTPALGMSLSFSGGGTIDPAAITIGNSASCVGSTSGGTTFCVSPFDSTSLWKAFQTGPSSIEFLAQSAATTLSSGQTYFVNVFFDGNTPTNFTGSWLTSFTPSPVPEPPTLALFAGGLLGLFGFSALSMWKKKAA